MRRWRATHPHRPISDKAKARKREYDRARSQTEHAKKLHRESMRKYYQSDKGKAAKTAYLATAQGKTMFNRARVKYVKSRKGKDEWFRFRCRLGDSIGERIRNSHGRKCAHTVGLIGCSVSFLREHLASLFQPGMSWENYGIYWEIDHIKPCKVFDLTSAEEQKLCFHYSNLQPLSKLHNRRKGARLDWIESLRTPPAMQ